MQTLYPRYLLKQARILTTLADGVFERPLNVPGIQVSQSKQLVVHYLILVLGNITLSSRSLPCIPSCLFEIHLGITPKPLDSVTEPEYPVDENPRRVGNKQTSWFEAQDLVVLKARSNEIVAIQPELSLFGSLKVIDVSPPGFPFNSPLFEVV